MGLTSRRGRATSRRGSACSARPRRENDCAYGARVAPFDKSDGRTMKRLLGVSIALCAASALSRRRRACGEAGTSASSRPAPISISIAIAAAGPSALPALIERGRVLFKAKFTTVDGAGRPKATQAIIPTKRKNGVNPPFSRTSGPDSNSCFGCHNDPVVGGSADDVANVFVSEGFESAQFELDRSIVLERAAHHLADGLRTRRASGARDDRGPAGASAPRRLRKPARRPKTHTQTS